MATNTKPRAEPFSKTDTLADAKRIAASRSIYPEHELILMMAAEIERLRKMVPPHPGLWFHEPNGTVRSPTTKDI